MATGITERERDIREKRAALWTAMVPLVEKAGKGESLTVEELTEYDARDADLSALDKELQTVLSMRGREAESRTERDEPDTRGARGDEKADREQRESDAFSKWFIGGDNVLTPEDRALLRPQVQGQPVHESRDSAPGGDSNPLSSAQSVAITGGTHGGYLIPAGFWHNLQVAMKAYGGIYPHFRQVDTDSGAPMNWPTTDPTALKAVLLSENTQVTPQDVTFGLGQLLAYTYVAGPFLASIQLVNDSAFSVDGFLRDRLSEAIGRKQADVAWSGTGSSQPLGIQAALIAKGASSGASGGVLVESAVKTVTTFGNVDSPLGDEVAAGAMSFSTVFDLIATIDSAYRGVSNAGPSATSGNPAWYMNDTTLQAQRKVTDQMGRPLIQQSVNVGGVGLGENLGGYPVVIDNEAPSLTGSTTPDSGGADASGPIFGSLQHAMVARNVRQVGVMVLRERYADYLSVAWLGYMRYDIRSNDMRAVAQASYKTAS